jgi:hypothetical protein
MSLYSVESMFLTLYESNKLRLYLDDTVLKPTSGFNFTTTSMEDFLPGLVETYGDNVPMGLLIYASDMPRAIF